MTRIPDTERDRPRQWVGGAELRAIWATDAAQGMTDDLERFGAGLVDPFTAE